MAIGSCIAVGPTIRRSACRANRGGGDGGGPENTGERSGGKNQGRGANGGTAHEINSGGEENLSRPAVGGDSASSAVTSEFRETGAITKY